MTELIVIILGGLLNRLRGWESDIRILNIAISKYAVSTYWGMLFALYANSVLSGVVVCCGIALWSYRGWGDYMDFSLKHNNEVRWIDNIAGKLNPGALNDTVSMCLRGMYGYPLFLILAVFNQNVAPVIWGIGVIGQGIMYSMWKYIWPDLSGKATLAAEWTMGGWLAWLIMNSI